NGGGASGRGVVAENIRWTVHERQIARITGVRPDEDQGDVDVDRQRLCGRRNRRGLSCGRCRSKKDTPQSTQKSFYHNATLTLTPLGGNPAIWRPMAVSCPKSSLRRYAL